MRFRLWIVVAVSIFAVGIVGGLIVRSTVSSSVSEFLSAEADAIEDIGLSIDISSPAMFIFIFLKNTIALGISFIFSPILCLMPLFALLLNSALLSYIGAEVVERESLGFLLSGILPHGILELPAFIIGEAAALYFGVATIVALFTRNREKKLLPAFKTSIRYLLISFALLLPAAVIETFVTPSLIR